MLEWRNLEEGKTQVNAVAEKNIFVFSLIPFARDWEEGKCLPAGRKGKLLIPTNDRIMCPNGDTREVPYGNIEAFLEAIKGLPLRVSEEEIRKFLTGEDGGEESPTLSPIEEKLLTAKEEGRLVETFNEMLMGANSPEEKLQILIAYEKVLKGETKKSQARKILTLVRGELPYTVFTKAPLASDEIVAEVVLSGKRRLNFVKKDGITFAQIRLLNEKPVRTITVSFPLKEGREEKIKRKFEEYEKGGFDLPVILKAPKWVFSWELVKEREKFYTRWEWYITGRGWLGRPSPELIEKEGYPDFYTIVVPKAQKDIKGFYTKTAGAEFLTLPNRLLALLNDREDIWEEPITMMTIKLLKMEWCSGGVREFAEKYGFSPSNPPKVIDLYQIAKKDKKYLPYIFTLFEKIKEIGG